MFYRNKSKLPETTHLAIPAEQGLTLDCFDYSGSPSAIVLIVLLLTIRVDGRF